MKRLCLQFTAPFRVDVLEEELDGPVPGKVIVETRFSAPSAGTEMLVFKGDFPRDMPMDEALPALAGGFRYPARYGYSCVGDVVAVGEGVEPAWLGRRVFAFHPHASLLAAAPEDLIPLPEGVSPEDAVFLPALETAVTLVMDGRPMVGERVAVLGLGVIGLVTVALLARHPLEWVTGIDRAALRRETALGLGAHRVLSDFGAPGPKPAVLRPDDPTGNDPADLVFELTGNPSALNDALKWAGFGSRVLVGSWYGSKSAPIRLGGRFHRDRVRILSSQVSTIAPELTGRWSRARRLAAAWRLLGELAPSRLVTHRFAVQEAQRAYERIASGPDGVLQVLLDYPG